MILRIPRLSPAECADPKQLSRRLNEILPEIARAFNGQQEALIAAGLAQAAADNANAAAESVTASSALANSTVTGLTITATDAGADVTISISAHTRVYGDGTTAAISGGTITGRPYSTDLWVFYDAAKGTAGAVTYQAATTVQGNASGNPNRHFVGAVTTPAALGSPIDGFPVLPPGGVYL